MLTFPDKPSPIQHIKTFDTIELWMKREDLNHQHISGNKYWKLFYTLNDYLSSINKNPLIITFGGAHSNHIAATSYAGKLANCKTIGIIRGEELKTKQLSPTLEFAEKNGMQLDFVTRDAYQDKEMLSTQYRNAFPNALIVEEGGTNPKGVKGIQHMLCTESKQFDYLCTAVGSGGTIAGLSAYALPHQKVIGLKAVNDKSLEEKIKNLSEKSNFVLENAHLGKYGKTTEALIDFINEFWIQHKIPLDPIYNGKMMMKMIEMIQSGYFPKGSKILAFHTGGLQGIEATNQFLRKKNKKTIQFI